MWQINLRWSFKLWFSAYCKIEVHSLYKRSSLDFVRFYDRGHAQRVNLSIVQRNFEIFVEVMALNIMNTRRSRRRRPPRRRRRSSDGDKTKVHLAFLASQQGMRLKRSFTQSSRVKRNAHRLRIRFPSALIIG